MNIQSKNQTLLRCVAVCAVVLTMSACDSCKEKPSAPDAGATTAPPPTAEPDTGPDVREDPLEEAREKAEEHGEDLAVHLGDRAMIASGEIAAAVEEDDDDDGGGSNPRIRKADYKGTIDAREAGKIFAKYEGAMKKCYERALKKNPGLIGNVTMRVVVDTDGSVDKVSAPGDSLRERSVTQCMFRYARRMEFPEPSGGKAKLEKTYRFEPQY
jgi:hypothetical protein